MWNSESKECLFKTLFYFIFWDRVWLCSPDCPQTWDPHSSFNQVLRSWFQLPSETSGIIEILYWVGKFLCTVDRLEFLKDSSIWGDYRRQLHSTAPSSWMGLLSDFFIFGKQRWEDIFAPYCKNTPLKPPKNQGTWSFLIISPISQWEFRIWDWVLACCYMEER
jgi:hypothetical protein